MSTKEKRDLEKAIDDALLTDQQRQRIDGKWKGSDICGRKPASYLGRLKKLHDAGLDVSDCHSFQNYGQSLDETTEALIDPENNREAHEEWLAIKRNDNLTGTRTYDVIIEDADGFTGVTQYSEPVANQKELIKAARKSGHDESLRRRKHKSKEATQNLLSQYRQAYPNQKALIATQVADWAVRVGICPHKERRNLIARLKRGFAT